MSDNNLSHLKRDCFEWTFERRVRARLLWDAGDSAAMIAQAIGTSKNSVIGFAHRNDFPKRAAPINRFARGTQPKPRPRLVVIRTLSGEQDTVLLTDRTRPAIVGSTLPPIRPEPQKETPPAPPQPKPQDHPGTCQWLIGEKPNWHFCHRPAVRGRPYCAEHCGLAYVPRNREAVA